jgi:hypothetical protein
VEKWVTSPLIEKTKMKKVLVRARRLKARKSYSRSITRKNGKAWIPPLMGMNTIWDSILSTVYPTGRCSWRVCLFKNKRSTNSSGGSMQFLGKMLSVLVLKHTSHSKLVLLSALLGWSCALALFCTMKWSLTTIMKAHSMRTITVLLSSLLHWSTTRHQHRYCCSHTCKQAWSRMCGTSTTRSMYLIYLFIM